MEEDSRENSNSTSAESVGKNKRLVGIILTLVGLFILLFITDSFTPKRIGIAWGISFIGIILYLYGFVERWWNRS